MDAHLILQDRSGNISFEIVFVRKLKCDFIKTLAPLCTTSFALHHLQSLLLLILYLLNAAFDTYVKYVLHECQLSVPCFL